MRHEAETKSNAYWLGLLAHLQATSVPRKVSWKLKNAIYFLVVFIDFNNCVGECVFLIGIYALYCKQKALNSGSRTLWFQTLVIIYLFKILI